jgi:hypothetical protein
LVAVVCAENSALNSTSSLGGDPQRVDAIGSDQMHVKVSRDGRVHRIQELPELGRAMPLMKLRDEP